MDFCDALFIYTALTFLLIFSVFHIARKRKCTKEIKGVYVESEALLHKGIYQYRPIFRYTYNGETFQQTCINIISEKKINTYQKDKEYTIFINPQKPKRSTITRKTSFADIFTLSLSLTGFIFFITMDFIY